MFNFIFFVAAIIYSVRMIAYAVYVIKEKNFAGGAGLIALSFLILASSVVSAVELFSA